MLSNTLRFTFLPDHHLLIRRRSRRACRSVTLLAYTQLLSLLVLEDRDRDDVTEKLAVFYSCTQFHHIRPTCFPVILFSSVTHNA